jgi:PAS domain-containing protein
MIDDAEARATEMSSTLFLELTTLLVFWLCVSVMQRNFQAEPRRLFVALTLACGAWCVGDICYRSELLAPIAVHRISFLGVFAFPPLWLGLAAHTADARRAKRYWWLPLALLVPCAAAYGLLYVDSLTHLVLELTEDGGTAMGPVMWIAAFYLWTLTGLGGALFILAALRMRGPGQQLRRAGVIVAAVLPLAVDVAFVGLDLGWKHDPMPITLGITLLLLYRAMFSGGLLGALPISQIELLTHLPVPILITDRRGTVVEANPAARGRLGLADHRTLWRAVEDVLAEASDAPDVEIWPLVSDGREAAQLVLLDPTSKIGPRRARGDGS